jgi:hypothetical protein
VKLVYVVNERFHFRRPPALYISDKMHFYALEHVQEPKLPPTKCEDRNKQNILKIFHLIQCFVVLSSFRLCYQFHIGKIPLRLSFKLHVYPKCNHLVLNIHPSRKCTYI